MSRDRYNMSSGKAARKPFLSIYEGAAADMMGRVVRSWNPEQRAWRERNIERTQGFRPVLRVNLTGHKS